MGLARQSYDGITYPSLSGMLPAYFSLMIPLRGVLIHSRLQGKRHICKWLHKQRLQLNQHL